MKLSSASTRLPLASSASQMCEPMNPAPPDTTARGLAVLRAAGGSRLVAADASIREAKAAHGRGVVDVAAVDDHRLPHRLLDTTEVEVAEFVPLRDQDQRVGAGGERVRVLDVFDLRLNLP